jgi:hypothetical protein
MTEHHRPDLGEMIRELTQPHQHREHYTVRVGTEWRGRNHIVTVPSLLTQLWDNDTPSATAEEGPRPGFQSKPAARLDALDTATRIDLEASRWIRDLGEDDRYVDTAATVRQLHSLVVSADAVTRAAVERDVRRWWTQARIVTGWDSPPWTPDNTCPQCGERGTLKIRLAERIGMCTHDPCRATWDSATIGLLADHIRSESMAERAPRRDPGPCWCPLPRPVVPDLSRLCPRCGTASCTHALGARLLDTLRGRIGA